MSEAADRYRRFAQLIEAEPLPTALVDLDALDRNIDVLVSPVRLANKTLRIASKSIRCPDLLSYIADRAGKTVRGIMCYAPREAHFLAGRGFDDLLVAYPSALPSDAALVVDAIARGHHVSLAADDLAHLRIADRAARERGVTLPIIVDIDVSYRPFGDRLSIGVRRSPLHTAEAVTEFVTRIGEHPNLSFAGLLAYEAHIAGVADDSRSTPLVDLVKRTMKRLAWPSVEELRHAVASRLRDRGFGIPLFNGGGSGSIEASSADPELTEVAAGSGFLDSHLFDGYRGLSLTPAIYFALQVTRRSSARSLTGGKKLSRYVTCQSGGFIASGASGRDRLPIVALPEGLSLTDLEGAGEVQTPLALSEGQDLEIGAPVFFRHAKAGELAEHFNEYLLVRGDRIVARAPTYRGLGQSFG